jgi:integrase
MDSVANSPKRVRAKAGKPQAYAAPPLTPDEKRARKDSANRILTNLKAALNHALDVGKVSIPDPCWRYVKPYRGTTKARQRFLSESEQVSLTLAAQGDFRDFVRAALLTGCRYSELARLTVADYYPDGKVQTIFVAESKSGKPRHIVLTGEGVKFFEGMTQGKKPTDPIFTHKVMDRATQSHSAETGKFEARAESMVVSTWKTSQANRLMKKACIDAGLEPLSFHELRHSYASMLIQKGFPMLLVAQQLGHSDARMVEKHYGHLADSFKASLFASLPDIGLLDPDTEPPKVQRFKGRRRA